ncbi:helix-turn-helix domain-containing protein [Aquimarina pacifica]|uniref:helix-turn-helix domain-containing protein n=1 Tax=Aquimarina pacifica TaxID=1296415 RepID=UPI00046F9DDA|nr:helix-turn-helix domain-containing protein [Aquimarina pacifica]
MEISRELLFFISAIGAFNGLVIGLYFVFFGKPKHRSHAFLGGLLLALSVRIGKSVFYYFNADLASFYIQFGLFACWFIGPFLFFYIKYATTDKEVKRKEWILHLIIVMALGCTLFLMFPREKYIDLWFNVFIYIIYYQWLIYLFAAGILLFKAFKIFKKEGRKKRNFELWILSIYVGNVIIWIVFNTASYTSYILGAISFSFIFYLLILLLLFSKERSKLLLKDPPKYGGKKIPQSEANRLIALLESLMFKEKLYRDSNITLSEVAKKLNILPNKLSQLLNEKLGKSFPSFLNYYRIEEAKELIKSNKVFSLESIGYDCGFSSKSAFYSAFRKQTGTTPSKYKEKS